MCGIVGIFQSEAQGDVQPEILRCMNGALAHRGPDDEGYWCEGRMGLAMRRLSIIDLEGGQQPVANEDGTVWTVFNGEIYNFIELRHELLKKGHRFKTRSDTEVIVHLYEEEGELFVHRLRGMFAIALWDHSSSKLLLYRDRIGIKPLHYSFQDGNLVFGSEIKAILEYPGIRREISLEALSDYLSFLYIPSPKTIYQSIQKLPAGHFLRAQNGKLTLAPYWDFSFSIQNEISERAWIERLRAALEDSVRLHMRSDVPVGAFLSGGMDSSTVVAWMSRLNPGRIKTYSMGFPDPLFNELPYARETAAYFKTEHHEQVVEPDAFALLEKVISGFDEPFADSSAIPTYLVSEFARKDVKVVLSGDGGDELFGGYLWTRKEKWLEQYRRLPQTMKRSIERLLLGGQYRPLRETTALSAVQRFCYDASLPPHESFARRSMCFQPWMKKELLSPWVSDALGKESSWDYVGSLYQSANAAAVIDKCFYLDGKIYLPDDLLTKVDRMSMMHSLEVRVPLLDHHVAELACSIPFSFKLKGRTTKYILKRAMKDALPPAVLRQRKQGFSIPLQKWFRNELAGYAKKILLSEGSGSHAYFRQEYIRQLIDAHTSGRQRFGTQLYALVVFELWHRIHGSGKQVLSAQPVFLKDIA